MCTALVPLLPECLNLLSSDTFSDAELLSSVLTCTCDILCEDVGRNAAADHAGAVLTALFRLAVPGQSSITMAVRTTALQGIIAAADLPYNKTYPHRKSLLKVLERSVDDPKRSVRAVAVQARTIWEAMPDV
jgi:DNA repair/transcription protein MET18/MMS19